MSLLLASFRSVNAAAPLKGHPIPADHGHHVRFRSVNAAAPLKGAPGVAPGACWAGFRSVNAAAPLKVRGLAPQLPLLRVSAALTLRPH